LLRENDIIPADILILSSSEPDGTCFIETKNLDGETNLKVKRGPNETNHIMNPIDCVNFRFYVDAEEPNANLFNFQARLVYYEEGKESVVPIGFQSLLLRGCVLRNTRWSIGIVIYTGRDSKIILNSGPTPSKRSRVDKQINPQVL
jgi:phospholipid-translocating ATPase